MNEKKRHSKAAAREPAALEPGSLEQSGITSKCEGENSRPEQFDLPARRARSRAAECTEKYMSSEASAQQSWKSKCEGSIGEKPTTFQGLITTLSAYWAEQGCIIAQPMDMEVGAGTFHPESFLRAIGPEPWRSAFAQGCRRPTDGRYGDNPNRAQHYYQFQVILKPSPINIQELYLNSLRAIGIDPLIEDIRFVEDNWESPTLGAWGLGWEVWQNGMEISQFTYFQQVGGLDCRPVTGEITYGLERIAMYLQGVSSIYDIVWSSNSFRGNVTYGDLFLQNEVEMSRYNFAYADIDVLFYEFTACERECKKLIKNVVPLAAYEMVLKASHIFNLLDARKAISVTERQNYILRIRTLAQAVADNYYNARKHLNFPLLTPAGSSQ